MSEDLEQVFNQPRLKLLRAKEHIGEIAHKIQDYIAKANCRAFLNETPEGWQAWTVRTDVPAPPNLPLILGDALHNLRTCLDWLAIAAVIANEGNPKGVYFPFCEKPEDLDKIIRDKNFHRAAPEVVNLVRSMRPYREGWRDLRAIHDLDIKDKHQMLLAAIQGAFAPPVQHGKIIATIDGITTESSNVFVRPMLALVDGFVSASIGAKPDPNMIGKAVPLEPIFYITEQPYILENALGVLHRMFHAVERIVEDIAKLAIGIAGRPK